MKDNSINTANSTVRFCPKCQAETSRNKNGRCKQCQKVTAAVWYANNKEKSKATHDAYYAKNSEKLNRYNAELLAANPERKKAYSRAYRAKNPEKVKAHLRAYYAANKEKLKVKMAAYNALNIETIAIANAAWRKANPEALRILTQNRRAKKRANGGTLSSGLSAKLFKLQRGKCACCGLPLGDDFHLDHVFPSALGGPNIDDNMQLLRKRCNLQKRAQHPVDFMQSRGFLL